jgi:DNA-binding transcriptional ArsR family regulator
VEGETDLSRVAALVAEPTRARILLALGDGRALPAGILADEAGVTPSTTSQHLANLVAGGLLRVEQYGRHRYFRIAGPAVAQAVEALGQLAPAAPIRSLREGTQAEALRRARACYDHLAGRLGVELMAALLKERLIEGGMGRSTLNLLGTTGWRPRVKTSITV